MIINILIAIVYVYLLWRNLRDNYAEDKLITFGWGSILLFLIGSRLAYGLVNWGVFETWSQWWQLDQFEGMIYGGGIGLVLGLCWWVTSRNGWKIWSFVEDLLPLVYVILAMLMINQWWQGKDIKVMLVALIMVLGFTLTKLFEGRYRSYPWYKSGKKGFMVGGSGVIISLVLVLESVVFKEGTVLLVIYSLLSLLSVVQLVILGDIWHKK